MFKKLQNNSKNARICTKIENVLKDFKIFLEDDVFVAHDIKV